jgi:hypothetical protein
MKVLQHMLIRLLFLILLCAPLSAPAQGGPAFDPDCYYPRVGVAGEIDTICGSIERQHMGAHLQGVGPSKTSPYNRIVIQGLPLGTNEMLEVQGGPNFMLDTLRKANKRSKISSIAQIIKRGPFRNTGSQDAFVLLGGGKPYIYWADSNNELSDENRTLLASSQRGNVGWAYVPELTYATYLSSDSIMDVVVQVCLIDTIMSSLYPRSYALHFKGGQSLFRPGETVTENERAFIDSADLVGFSSQGDWRGIGRDDLILASGDGNGWFYRNNSPFVLDEFVRALKRDTLWAGWQYAMQARADGILRTQSMRAFPKAPGDSSYDYMPNFPLKGDSNLYLWMFRGGPNFGSQRLHLDRPDYMIKHPASYGLSGVTWGPSFVDCGDMTGTGNRVLGIGGRSESSGFAGVGFFYVTGKALDDKIDMYSVEDYFWGGPIDSLTADRDVLQDVIIGSPAYKNDIGTVHILHGSKRIPVRPNPQFASVNPAKHVSALIVYPNPAKDAVTISAPTIPQGIAQIEIFDVLGRQVMQTEQEIGNLSEHKLELPHLLDGQYLLQLRSKDQVVRATVSILH